MGALGTTNREIIEGIRRQRRERAARARILEPIRLVDALIADLEELHLAGRTRVPDAFVERLVALDASLPLGLHVEPRSRITIVRLMDELYAVQDTLLARKVGERPPDDDARPLSPAC